MESMDPELVARYADQRSGLISHWLTHGKGQAGSSESKP